jgi:iron complex outermembrane recepter protein
LDRRSYSSRPLQILDSTGTATYFGSTVTPYGPIFVPNGNLLGLAPGRYQLNTGAAGRSPTDYHRFTKADTFNYEPYNYSQTPNERTTAWLQGSLPVGGAATAFVEGLWSYRRSSQRLAPTPYASDFDIAPELADGSFGIPANNYYNPFGVDIPLLRRRFVEINDRGLREEVRMWRTVVGLRGTVGQWHWEASAGYSTSDAVTRENGLISYARLLPAIGASGPDANGTIVCGSPDASGVVPAANIAAGCVPVDLFGGPGTITPEQVAYLEVPLRDEGQNSQRMLDLNAEGTWGSLSGQPVSWPAVLPICVKRVTTGSTLCARAGLRARRCKRMCPVGRLIHARPMPRCGPPCCMLCRRFRRSR